MYQRISMVYQGSMSPYAPSHCRLLICLATATLLARGQNASAHEAAIPDVPTFMEQVQDHQRKLDQTRENYTYREVVVTHELDKNGSVKKTESEESDDLLRKLPRDRSQGEEEWQGASADEQKKEQDRVMKEIEKAQKTPPGKTTDKKT